MGSAPDVAVLSALLQNSSAVHADARQPVINASNCEAVVSLDQLARGLTEGGPDPEEAVANALKQMAAATSENALLLAFRDCLSSDSAGVPDPDAPWATCTAWKARSIKFHRSPEGRFDPVPLSFEAWGDLWAAFRTTGQTCVEKD
jgi:hypothetical protein